MCIIGHDFHPRYQQIAAFDSATGETVERRLNKGKSYHSETRLKLRLARVAAKIHNSSRNGPSIRPGRKRSISLVPIGTETGLPLRKGDCAWQSTM